jgi:FMN phosphatase YigB (HAD superfamily)
MFDWTGTLVDEHDLDEDMCLNMELEISRKLTIPVEEAKRRYRDLLIKYGNSWEWYNYPLHGDIFKIDWRKAHASALPKIRMIPGAIDVLSYYKGKGYCICMLTNAVKEVIDIRIDYLRMRSFFDLIVTSDIVKSTKSSGKHLDLALRSIDVSKEDAYMIGDSLTQDILPAKKFKLVTIQCKFGVVSYNHTKNHDNDIDPLTCAPDYIINNTTELFSIIK